MSPRTKHWLKFSIRWGIAIVGIGWVLWGITFRDRVTVLARGTNLPEYAQVLDNATEDQAVYRAVREGDPARVIEKVPREDIWVRPDRKYVEVRPETGGPPERRTLLAVKPFSGRGVGQVLVKDPGTGNGVVVDSSRLANVGEMTVSLPRVEIG